MIGVYSAEAAEYSGTSIYATPDGREVEVTAVYDPQNLHMYKWPDKWEVGEVSRWIRDGRRGTWLCIDDAASDCTWNPAMERSRKTMERREFWNGSNTMIGVFSEEAAKMFGSNFYATPDGREVEVTAIYCQDHSQYLWPDKQEVGEVTHWIRKGRCPIFALQPLFWMKTK